MSVKCPFCGEDVAKIGQHIENQHDERALETGEQKQIGPEDRI
ncbi:hypothetical protein ACFQGE_07450 [Halomicroarcula sp. GCM10025817]|nr:hypothetical protein [Halomicroarcula sp. SYNS111]